MKSETYDIVIITNIPAFYKINLYNGINRQRRIFVIYTGHGDDGRNSDFYRQNSEFESTKLKSHSKFVQIFETVRLLRGLEYRQLIISGWDHPVMWLAAMLSPSRKNSGVVESSIYESKASGIKGFIKRLFLKRVCRVYASGKSQKMLLDRLKFRGEIIITKGVGVFNFIAQPLYSPRSSVENFIYVGRLIECKNLRFLVKVFSSRKDVRLHIVGFGELEADLKAMAGDNIIFHGAVDNRKLPEIYQSMDVFILPSFSETWGLVVEEALNNGLPVLVSNRVGCSDEIVNSTNGLVFRYDSEDELNRCIDKMQDVDYYNSLRKSISMLDFENIEKEQISKYLSDLIVTSEIGVSVSDE